MPQLENHYQVYNFGLQDQMKYFHIFDFIPIQGYPWNDTYSSCLIIEAENKEEALNYGKQLAEYFVFSAWPEESWYEIYGRIENELEGYESELEFRVGYIPQTTDVERWLAGKFISSRNHFNYIAKNGKSNPVKIRAVTPDGSGLSWEDYLDHIWIPCGEVHVIREMSDRQKIRAVGVAIEDACENWVYQSPTDGGLLTFFTHTPCEESREKFSAWYNEWQQRLLLHLPKLRNWEFDSPVYEIAKMEQLLLLLDELFRALLADGDSVTPVFRVWKICKGWSNGGPYHFPMLADSEEQARRWTMLLTPQSKVKSRTVAIFNILFSTSCDCDPLQNVLWAIPIMLSVFGIAFGIVYGVPEKLQWWVFSGFFALVVVMIFVHHIRKRHRKLNTDIYTRLNALEDKLHNAGFCVDAEKLKDSVAGGATSTEILCLAYEALQQILYNKTLPKDVKEEITSVISDIKEILAKSNSILTI